MSGYIKGLLFLQVCAIFLFFFSSNAFAVSPWYTKFLSQCHYIQAFSAKQESLLSENDKRSTAFIAAILPLGVIANRDILLIREKLIYIAKKRRISREDNKFLIAIYKKYKVNYGDMTSLLNKINIIPLSLLLAQSIIESNWGTSRFAIHGNAIFGQWGTTGMRPLHRKPNFPYRVIIFTNLLASVKSYIFLLNSSRHYDKLRKIREQLLFKGYIKGLKLAAGLSNYSQKGNAYNNIVTKVIKTYDLDALDNISLEQFCPNLKMVF